jgi:lipopolysaccharide transport system ATP-binding protein
MVSLTERTDRSGKGDVKLIGVEITNGDDTEIGIIKAGGPAKFRFNLSGLMANLSCGFVILDGLGQPIARFKSNIPSPEDKESISLKEEFVCEIDELLLVPGRYQINVFIRGGGERQDLIEGAAFFDVEIGILRGRPISQPNNKRISAVIPHRWKLPQSI